MDQQQVTKKVEQLHQESTRKVTKYTLDILVEQVVWGYTILNFLLFLGFIDYHGSIALFVAGSAFLVKVWAFIFLVTGILMLGGLRRHSLVLLRYSMLLGLFIKATWLIALVIKIAGGSSIIIIALWGLVTYIQLWVYYYFTMESRYVRRI